MGDPPGFQHSNSGSPDRDRTGGELPRILSLSINFQPSESGRKAGLSMNVPRVPGGGARGAGPGVLSVTQDTCHITQMTETESQEEHPRRGFDFHFVTTLIVTTLTP